MVIENLHDALIDAANAYVIAIDTDAELQARLIAHLPILLCYQPYPEVAPVR